MSDERLGQLSVAEARYLPLQGRDRREAREHYDSMVATAEGARDELRESLVTCEPLAKTTALINAFAWANLHLWRAAQRVCQVERLPYEGKNDGITWEVQL